MILLDALKIKEPIKHLLLEAISKYQNYPEFKGKPIGYFMPYVLGDMVQFINLHYQGKRQSPLIQKHSDCFQQHNQPQPEINNSQTQGDIH